MKLAKGEIFQRIAKNCAGLPQISPKQKEFFHKNGYLIIEKVNLHYFLSIIFNVYSF